MGYLKTVLNPSFLYKPDKMLFELRARRTGEKFYGACVEVILYVDAVERTTVSWLWVYGKTTLY